MYQFSVPVFLRHFEVLKNILRIAMKNAEDRKINPDVFFNARLAPDMLPLPKQIQIASDVTKGGVARLTGTEVPSFADTEKTFEELLERIEKTVAFIKSVPAEKFSDSETREIKLTVGGNEITFSGLEYLQTFVVPNFYFHVTTAYAILRAQGVPLGKMNYLKP